MGKIKQDDYQKRLDRLSNILADVASHADKQSLTRCPYKNRHNECTAQFNCRNQQKSLTGNKLPHCNSNDNLEYRSAWETIATSKTVTSKEKGAGQILSGSDITNSSNRISLFEAADSMGISLPTSCYRNGACHECIVEIQNGIDGLNKPTKKETFLRPPYRLACQARVIDPNVDIEFLQINRTPRILTQANETTASDNTPTVTKKNNSVYLDDNCIDSYRGNLFGIAIDLGTTTVVMELVNLENGFTIETASFENPQRFGGSDVMNRISYDGTHPGELRRAIVRAINKQIQYWCTAYSFVHQCIYEIVIAGNSTMRDILFRLNVQGIGQKPYKSLIELEVLNNKRLHSGLSLGTRRLGLRANPKARAYGIPIIASHVGGDAAANLCAIELDIKSTGSAMVVDVGTNTEVIALHNGRMLAASCPAGPAFEGGTVTYGMPGYEGAIESLGWKNNKWHYETIGSKPPQGICGSGLIDLLAELRRHSKMTEKGVFSDKLRELTIVPEYGITFSRLDASNLAQAKAANYCGQLIVLRTLQLAPKDLDYLYLSGGFANYVDVQSAIDIGFLPPVPKERIVKIGNGALQGARHVLLSGKRRNDLEVLTKNIEHIELETTHDFFDMFVDGCQFNPMPDEFN